MATRMTRRLPVELDAKRTSRGNALRCAYIVKHSEGITACVLLIGRHLPAVAILFILSSDRCAKQEHFPKQEKLMSSSQNRAQSKPIVVAQPCWLLLFVAVEPVVPLADDAS